MNANVIEFDTAVEDGMIQLPVQYKNFTSQSVRVLIFPLDEMKPDSIKKRMEYADALTGIIPDNFDLDLMREERIMRKA